MPTKDRNSKHLSDAAISSLSPRSMTSSFGSPGSSEALALFAAGLVSSASPNASKNCSQYRLDAAAARLKCSDHRFRTHYLSGFRNFLVANVIFAFQSQETVSGQFPFLPMNPPAEDVPPKAVRGLATLELPKGKEVSPRPFLGIGKRTFPLEFGWSQKKRDRQYTDGSTHSKGTIPPKTARVPSVFTDLCRVAYLSCLPSIFCLSDEIATEIDL